MSRSALVALVITSAFAGQAAAYDGDGTTRTWKGTSGYNSGTISQVRRDGTRATTTFRRDEPRYVENHDRRVERDFDDRGERGGHRGWRHDDNDEYRHGHRHHRRWWWRNW